MVVRPTPINIVTDLIGAFFGFSSFYWIIGLASAIFVHQDAKKRQNSLALPWAIGVFILWLPGIILYLIFRGPSAEERLQGGPMKRFKRTYFYLVAFISLCVLYWGLADLGRVILEYFWGKSVSSYYSSVYLFDTFKRDVSFRLASIMVSLPLWIFHWSKAIEEVPADQPSYKFHNAADKRNFSLLVLGITGFIILITGIWLIYEVLNVFLGVSNRHLKDFGMPLSYTVVSLVTWAYHFQIFKKVTEELKELRSKIPNVKEIRTKLAPAPAKKYCGHCGTMLTAGTKFCSGCGTKIG